tara:strand:- start:4381 stop:4548 length:168 start_codon:yes stop_codon:yes gene_type:complete
MSKQKKLSSTEPLSTPFMYPDSYDHTKTMEENLEVQKIELDIEIKKFNDSELKNK